MNPRQLSDAIHPLDDSRSSVCYTTKKERCLVNIHLLIFGFHRKKIHLLILGVQRKKVIFVDP
jgi:hypothetical protein